MRTSRSYAYVLQQVRAEEKEERELDEMENKYLQCMRILLGPSVSTVFNHIYMNGLLDSYELLS
jgi:hypothetical protein